MKKGDIGWIRVIRIGDDARDHSRLQLAFVVTPPE